MEHPTLEILETGEQRLRMSYSAVLGGFWLRPAWLWQAQRPQPLTAFLEIRGLSPESITSLQDMLRNQD